MKKKLLQSSLHVFIGLVGLGLTGIAFPDTAQADHIGCGTTIGPNEDVDLDSDLNCDVSTGPWALIVEGPGATLDLNQFTVSCMPDENGALPGGILITGDGAEVKEGSVINCDVGVQLGEEPPDGEVPLGGDHTVKRVYAEGHVGDCFHVDNNGNELSENAAIGCDDGFDIDGEENLLRHNTADNNEDDGFDLDGGNTEANDNTATGNGDNGFSVNGMGFEGKDNAAIGNVDRGYDFDGNEAKVRDSLALNNGEQGFRIDDGNNVSIKDCTSIGNGQTDDPEEQEDRDGIEVNSDFNEIEDNIVLRNVGNGIELNEAAENNQVEENIVRLNAGDADLVDLNADCDNNDWDDNVFGSSNNTDCIE